MHAFETLCAGSEFRSELNLERLQSDGMSFTRVLSAQRPMENKLGLAKPFDRCLGSVREMRQTGEAHSPLRANRYGLPVVGHFRQVPIR